MLGAACRGPEWDRLRDDDRAFCRYEERTARSSGQAETCLQFPSRLRSQKTIITTNAHVKLIFPLASPSQLCKLHPAPKSIHSHSDCCFCLPLVSWSVEGPFNLSANFPVHFTNSASSRRYVCPSTLAPCFFFSILFDDVVYST